MSNREFWTAGRAGQVTAQRRADAIRETQNDIEKRHRAARQARERAERENEYVYFFDWEIIDIDGKEKSGAERVYANNIVSALERFTEQTGIPAQSITYIENR